MTYNYDEMELDELESLHHALQDQKELLRVQMIELKKVMSEKRAYIAAQQALARLSDPERAALHQIVGVQMAHVKVTGKGVE